MSGPGYNYSIINCLSSSGHFLSYFFCKSINCQLVKIVLFARPLLMYIGITTKSVIDHAIQEEKYIKYVDGLKLMLERYHTVLGSLNVAEVCT